MAELYIGTPIFASESEKDHLSMMMEVIGLPPKSMIEASPKKSSYFDENNIPRPFTNSKGRLRHVNAKPLNQLL